MGATVAGVDQIRGHEVVIVVDVIVIEVVTEIGDIQKIHMVQR